MSSIRLRFVRSGAFSPDGHTQVTVERGEVVEVPESVAGSLVRGATAVPVDPESVDATFGGEEAREAETVLRKHDLTVRSVPGDEDVAELQERHEELTERLHAARAELKDAEAEAEQLRSDFRDAKVGKLTGEANGNGPSRGEVEDAEARRDELAEQVDVIREALDRTSASLAEALDRAHDKAEKDAKNAHAALLRKGIDRARKLRALLEDLEAFEAAYDDRLGSRRVGSLDGVENWIERAEKHA